METSFVKLIDGLVYLLSSDRRLSLESICGSKFAARSLLGCDQVAKQDVPVCQGFLDDQSIRGVIVQRVRKRRCFSSALSRMIVPSGLDDSAELAVSYPKTGMCLLNM